MRYLMFTYVNLKFPDVKGLKFGFSLESRYPLQGGEVETFYGTCDSDAFLSAPGVIGEITETQYNLDRDREMYNRKKIPEEVTAAQAKAALFDKGIYNAVEQLVINHPYARVRIWWDAARAWRKDNPYVLSLGFEMNLSSDEIDELFVAASKIVE